MIPEYLEPYLPLTDTPDYLKTYVKPKDIPEYLEPYLPLTDTPDYLKQYSKSNLNYGNT